MPGDLVFIFLGALPIAIAAVKAYLGMRHDEAPATPTWAPANADS